MHLRLAQRIALAIGLSVALAGMGAVPATAAAGTGRTAAGQWQLMGPNAGGGRLAFTKDMPSRLYVLPEAGHGVYRSDDHGRTWHPQVGLGVPGAFGSHLAADPHDADVVYVAATDPATQQGYLVRSDDAAQTFHPVLTSPSGLADVAVSPTGRDVFAAGDAGVYASSDGGAHWHLLPASPEQATTLGLDGDDLFVGTASGVDVIEHAVGSPLAARKLPLPEDLLVQKLAVREGVVVASSVLDTPALSTDHGRTWRLLTGPWDPGAAIVYTGMTARGVIQVQSVNGMPDGSTSKDLWTSGDLGRTWHDNTVATAKVDAYNDTGSFPDRPGEQVVAAAAGIYTTHDSSTYRRIGVPATPVRALAVMDGNLIAGTESGSYRSAAPLAAHPPAGYQDWSWTGRAPDTIGNSIGALTAVPGTPDVLRTRNTFCGGADCFVLEHSADGGATWHRLAVGYGRSQSLAVDPRHPSAVYAASHNPAGVYAATDGGTGMELHAPADLQGVTSVAVDPRDGSLWIGDITGLYHSTDAGATVHRVFDGEVGRVAVDPQDPSHVVAVGTGFVKVSRDEGASFHDGSAVAGLSYDDVAFGPDGTVYAASHDYYEPGQGVFRSTDGGMHWTSISGSLVDLDVHALLVSPDGRWLFAGTGGNGLYRLALR